MQKLRAAGALFVLFLFPVVVLAVLAGLVALLLLVGSQSAAFGRLLVQLLFLPVVIGIIAAVRQVARVKPQPAEGPELGRAEHPQLWAAIDELAAAARTAPPERVVLTAEVNAAVSQVGGRRHLELGLPLLAGLTVGELRAVLAHELGHFAGGDTALAARTLRARILIVAMRDHAGALTRWFFSLYYRVVVLLSAASSRDVERRADGYSAEVAGPEVAASALRKLFGIEMAWSFVVEDRVSMFEAAGARAPLHEAVTRALRIHEESIQRATEQLLREETLGWDDTHPRTSDRISAFAAMPAVPFARDDRQALVLVGGGAQHLSHLEGELLTTDWPLSSWEAVAAAAMHTVLPQRMERLVLAMHEEGAIDEATPAALLRAVRSDPTALGERLIDEQADAAQTLDAATQAAAEVALIVTRGVLARADGVRVVFDERDELAFLDADGAVIDTEALAADAHRLAEQLLVRGIELDRPADPSAREQQSVVLGALTMTRVKQAGKRLRDLLVCSDGLLFVPLHQSRVDFALGGATKHNQQLRIEALARRLPELRADPQNQWIPGEAVTSAHLRILPARLTITLVDGARIAVDFDSNFEEIAVLVEHPLQALLGERLTRGKQRVLQPQT